MRIQNGGDHDPNYYLYFTDDIFMHIINDWEQLFGKWNWLTFHFAHIYFEKDFMCGGYEFEFVILGLGFRLRINDKNSEGYKEINKRIEKLAEDIEKKEEELNNKQKI